MKKIKINPAFLEHVGYKPLKTEEGRKAAGNASAKLVIAELFFAGGWILFWVFKIACKSHSVMRHVWAFLSGLCLVVAIVLIFGIVALRIAIFVFSGINIFSPTSSIGALLVPPFKISRVPKIFIEDEGDIEIGDTSDFEDYDGEEEEEDLDSDDCESDDCEIKIGDTSDFE